MFVGGAERCVLTYMVAIGTTRRLASYTMLAHVQLICAYDYHSSTRKDIPAETNAVAVFHFGPAVLELIICCLVHVA